MNAVVRLLRLKTKIVSLPREGGPDDLIFPFQCVFISFFICLHIYIVTELDSLNCSSVLV